MAQQRRGGFKRRKKVVEPCLILLYSFNSLNPFLEWTKRIKYIKEK